MVRGGSPGGRHCNLCGFRRTQMAVLVLQCKLLQHSDEDQSSLAWFDHARWADLGHCPGVCTGPGQLLRRIERRCWILSADRVATMTSICQSRSHGGVWWVNPPLILLLLPLVSSPRIVLLQPVSGTGAHGLLCTRRDATSSAFHSWTGWFTAPPT